MFSKLFTQKSGFGDRQKVSVSEIRIFGQKSIFFQWDPVFCQKTIGAYGHGLPIGVGPVPKSFSVSDLGHFS